LPMAIQGVLFPAFATMYEQASPRTAAVFKRSSQTTLLLITPPVVACVLLAHEALRLWVGSSFADHSATVARILAVGVLINSMARPPFRLVQGVGRASWTALLHLLEIPLYLGALWWGLKAAAIDGAAAVWTARVLLDTIALYWMGIRVEPRVARTAGV